MTPKKSFAVVFVATLFGLVILMLAGRAAVAALATEPMPIQPVIELPPPAPETATVTHTIARGDTLGTILPAYGAPISEVREAALGVYDLAKLRAGQELMFVYRIGETRPFEVRYPLDEDRTLVVVDKGLGWQAEVRERPYETRMGVRELVVESSLWSASIGAGLRAQDIVNLAAVFEYDIDFNTEVVKGARARLVVDEEWLDGTFVKLGTPHAIIFENAGKEYVAVRFESEPGKFAYYDRDGISRKGAFLRSPLAFSQVTSGFNPKRYHPVLKKTRPHNGTDFGAPTGTPVRAVAEGVVTWAGTSGGHGNFVKIDHTGPYESSYSHLSQVSVKKGQTVKQGQLIGKVGSTGMSTGPHLHYQFWVNGRFVNPMKLDLPREEKLAPEKMVAFEQARDRYLAMLEGAQASN